MGFKEELREFHEKIKYINSDDTFMEEIGHADALSALIVLNFIKYEKIADLFLGVASINLLNRYVKQKNALIGYQFRIHLINTLKGIEDINQKKTVLIGYESSQNNLLIIQFWNFQFSFQAEKLTGQVEKLLSKKNICWDGIKKQPCARTIFRYALENSWLGNKTMIGENLLQLIEVEVKGFHKGEYKIVNGQFVKIKNIQYRLKEGTDVQRNYMRFKLFECQDRPVILLGKFARVWDKHVTFVTISPYIKQMVTMPVCDHINLYRPDVEKILDISGLVTYDRYYIIGYCKKYPSSDRMGVNLAMDLGLKPILRVQDFKNIPRDIFEKCHRFSIEEYMGFCQKEIFL